MVTLGYETSSIQKSNIQNITTVSHFGDDISLVALVVYRNRGS